MRILHFAAALLLLGTAPAAAIAQDAAEQRRIDWALERGRLLFALDRAAWVATDDMVARLRDPVAAGVNGYIVDRDAQGFSTIFFGREGDRLVAVYRARIGRNGVEQPQVFSAGARPALSPVQERMARALIALRSQPRRGCSRSVNIAIVPPPALDAPMDAYVMTPQERTDVWPFGGHNRVTLARDGSEVANRAFTRSCIAVPGPTAQQRAQGAMLGVSHSLDAVPTEIHVFSALAAGMPIGVITENPSRLWEVTGDRIRLLPQGGNRR